MGSTVPAWTLKKTPWLFDCVPGGLCLAAVVLLRVLIAQGGFFSEQDQTQGNAVAVIGQTVATNLFPNGQDPLGQQAVTVSQVPNPDDPGAEVFEGRQKTEMPKVLEVLARPMEDGSLAAGLFNRSTKPAKVTARWADLKIAGKRRVRDLWRQKDLGSFEGEFSADVRPHGVVMVQLFAEK